MSDPIQIKPNLIDEINNFGAFDISACFNCGTCTSTCTLVNDNNQFPRSIIRLAQLGLKEKLKGSKELWMCYYCGECSTACPRGADPASFMQAARRYAISEYEPIGMGKIFNKHKIFASMIMIILGVLFANLMEFSNSHNLFGSHDYIMFGGYYGEIIHYSGIAMAIFLSIILGIGFYNMYHSIAFNEPLRKRKFLMNEISRITSFKIGIKTLWNILFDEGFKQKRFMRVDPSKGIYYEEGDEPEYLRVNMSLAPNQKSSRRTIHMSIVWGFIGLAIATAFDYLIKDIILNDPAGWVPIYHPVRLLGIISGISLMFGTTMSMYYRIIKPDDNEFYRNSRFDDWLLLIFLWIIGTTGFILTILVYIPILPDWGHWILIAHIVSVGELFLIIPFTKFAHIMYRPLALWMQVYEDAKIEYLENIPVKTKNAIKVAL